MGNKLFAKQTYTVGIDSVTERNGVAVTADDSNDLPNGPCKAIYVTGSGDVAVNLSGGGTATLTSLAAGQIVHVGASRILSTGTTATGIYALYPAGSL